MRDGMMSLNQFTPISIHRDAHCLAWFWRATFHKRRTMNKNIAALLRVDHAQLTNFGPIMPRNVQQSPIPDLTAHLGVQRRAIDNDI